MWRPAFRGDGLRGLQLRGFCEHVAAVSLPGVQLSIESPARSPGQTSQRCAESDGPPGQTQVGATQGCVPGDVSLSLTFLSLCFLICRMETFIPSLQHGDRD